MFTMLPRSRASMPGRTAWQACSVPLRFTSITRSHSSSVIKCTGPPPATPAEFTSKSICPYSVSTSATARPTAPLSRTSSLWSGPASASSTASSQSPPMDFWRSMPAMRAPSWANRRAIAAPIPEAAPVITATFPSRRPMLSPLDLAPDFHTSNRRRLPGAAPPKSARDQGSGTAWVGFRARRISSRRTSHAVRQGFPSGART